MQEFTTLDGALLIDKPAGPTSHDVVALIRRQFRIEKVGHCGTLDPNATGLLVIVLGRGTKLSEKLMSDDKLYEGDIHFGVATDSYDADGEVTGSLPVPLLTVEELNTLAAEFVGDQMQTPPMVSAVKKAGVPLYKLARKGIEVPRAPRLIHIYRFRFSDFTNRGDAFNGLHQGHVCPQRRARTRPKVGCGAHLATLRRVSSGKSTWPCSAARHCSPVDSVELEKRVLPF